MTQLVVDFLLRISRMAGIPLPTELVLESTDLDFPATGLLVSSTLQLHRLMTGATVLIQRELGLLPPRLRPVLAERLHRLFDLK
jgi:hypothetical protein